MNRIFYQQDCDLQKLSGKTVAIIGYGSQGHAHALNLKESGVNVIVGLYNGSKSWAKAEAQGMTVMTAEDAAKAADELCKRKAVILNMENVDKALTRRVVDFLSGAVYALDGRVKKVAQSTYLFCPHNMDVTGDLENIKAENESYV